MPRDLRYFTPTLCRLLAVAPPEHARSELVADAVASAPTVSRALVYCPDAFGRHALDRYPALAERLRICSTHSLDLRAMFPPKTPVCFASLFTGASPEEHGIKKYERPILRCQTLFDALVAAGRRVAIVAVRDSSIDRIFRERPIDYHSLTHDSLATATALELMHANTHDVIVLYHQEYDDLLHATEPFSHLAERALHNHVETWELLTETAESVWKRDYFVAFTPDHGGHVDPMTKRGTHGEDSPDDMQVRHFFRRR